jgi:hypothetical protein
VYECPGEKRVRVGLLSSRVEEDGPVSTPVPGCLGGGRCGGYSVRGVH